MMSPRKRSRTLSMSSGVTCSHLATASMAPMESYESVEEPSMAVVRYSFADERSRIGSALRLRGVRRGG